MTLSTYRAITDRVGVGIAHSTIALVVMLCLVLVLTGCRVDSTLNVSLSRDGGAELSVVVNVDSAVAQRLSVETGEPRLEGLKAAGWTTSSEDRADGSRTFTSTARCVTPMDCVSALDALGVFRDLTIGVDPGRVEDQISLSGVIDLGGGLAVFGIDSTVVTDESLQRAYGITAAQATTFTVVVEAPAGFDVVAPGASVEGRKATWQAALGSAVPMSLEARESASQTLLAARVAAGLGVVGVSLFILLAVSRFRQRRAMRRRPSRAYGDDEAALTGADDDTADFSDDDGDDGDDVGQGIDVDDDDDDDELSGPYPPPKHAR